jgi:predicted outer membrane repeat protein
MGLFPKIPNMSHDFIHFTSRLRVAVLGVALFVFGGPRASWAVLYVDASAGGSADGGSWSNAFTGLPQAMAAAIAGDQVWVKAATYGSFTQATGVAVYGGFAGGETDLSQRNWTNHVTAIDGAGGRAVTGAKDAVLDGFVITNTTGAGGGYYMYRVGATIRNCRFIGNSGGEAVVLSQTGANGGAGGTALVQRCVFQGNDGGLGYSGRNNLVSGPHHAVIDGCLFVGNTSSAINAEHACDWLRIENCMFNNNSAVNGGAIYMGYSQYALATTVGVYNCTFVDNQATSYGKAIFLSYQTPLLALVNCIIRGADTSQVELRDGTPELTVSYCHLQNGTNSIHVRNGVLVDGGGNSSEDPLFQDPDGADNVPATLDDNFRLSQSSPCVDSGTPTNASNHDLAGESRPQGNGYDRGAFELPKAVYGMFMLFF